MVAREFNAPSSEGTELNIIGMWKPKGLQQLWFGMGTEDTLSTLELVKDVMISKKCFRIGLPYGTICDS